MLDHRQAAGRREKRRAGGQIQAAGGIAAGPDDVDGIAAPRQPRSSRQRSHCRREAAQLGGRDIVVWCGYAVDHFAGREIPFTIEHVFSTLYGWQRWPGDEHKSGWHLRRLEDALDTAGFVERAFGVELFLARGLSRNRFFRPHDAHFYCVATKSS